MKAILKNYRQSPRKVRLVAGLIRGKSVGDALTQVQFLPKRASVSVEKLLRSAISNAKQAGAQEDTLFIKDIRVDEGYTIKRFMPRAMGRAAGINKRTSHITLILGAKDTLSPTPEATKEDKKTDTKDEGKIEKVKATIVKKEKKTGTKSTKKKNTSSQSKDK